VTSRSALLPALLVVAGCALLAQDLAGRVSRVVDGDTIEVEVGGARERVRYIGIDAPEWTDERSEVRALARAATEANARLVAGRRVRLELDVERRDRYGRLLAYVWIGDTLVNEAIVRSGHAVPFTVPPNVRHAERFRTAAREAREAGVDPRDAPTGKADLPAVDPTAPTDPESAIAAAEAAAHAGQRATVCGLVADSRWLGPGRFTFLNLGRPYPDQDLTVVIRDGDRTAFPVPPEKAYREREICVTGRIEIYRGAPQIVVRGPEAIAILD
jgi:micrococcal nuclease